MISNHNNDDDASDLPDKWMDGTQGRVRYFSGRPVVRNQELGDLHQYPHVSC